MIEVTKINGVKLLVNTSLIETVEETHSMQQKNSMQHLCEV